MSALDAIDFGMSRLAAMDAFEPFFQTIAWPNVQRDYLMKPHLKQLERLNFMAFLIGNGMDPSWASSWVLSTGTYDKQAIEHVRTLAEYLPNRRINTTYYDITLGKYVNLQTGEELPGSTGQLGKRKY